MIYHATKPIRLEALEEMLDALARVRLADSQDPYFRDDCDAIERIIRTAMAHDPGPTAEEELGVTRVTR